MTDALSWCISPDEKINVTTEDGVNISLFAGRASEGIGVLDIAPRFRYIVRVANLAVENFSVVSSKLLFTSAVLIMPHKTDNGAVTSVVLMSMNVRMLRITHGLHPQGNEESLLEADPRKHAWTTQHYKHHRSPTMRPKSPPKVEV